MPGPAACSQASNPPHAASPSPSPSLWQAPSRRWFGSARATSAQASPTDPPMSMPNQSEYPADRQVRGRPAAPPIPAPANDDSSPEVTTSPNPSGSRRIIHGPPSPAAPQGPLASTPHPV